MEIRNDLIKELEIYWASGDSALVPSDWYYSRWDNGRKEVIEYHLSGDAPTAITLYWNGARWVVWMKNKRFIKGRWFEIGDELSLFVAEPTEYKDKNDPPLEWALGIFDLT